MTTGLENLRAWPLAIFLAAVATAHVLALAWLFRQYRQRRHQELRRRPPPVAWSIEELLLLGVFYVALQSVFAAWVMPLGINEANGVNAPVAEEAQQHPLAVLLEQDTRWPVLILCVASAVILAPLAEELLFRHLLQGGLAVWERRWFRLRGDDTREQPYSLFPIVASSLLFALIHWRDTRGPPLDAELLIKIILAGSLTNLSFVCGVSAWSRWRHGDWGWTPPGEPSSLRRDVRLAGLALAACVVPVYLVQLLAQALLAGSGIAPDPIPLFGLALVLGGLFAYTGRLAPCVLLHAGFNALSLLGWSLDRLTR